MSNGRYNKWKNKKRDKFKREFDHENRFRNKRHKQGGHGTPHNRESDIGSNYLEVDFTEEY